MYDETIDVDAIELSVELTTAWLSNPNTRASGDDAAKFLVAIHSAVSSLAGQPAVAGRDGVDEAPEVVPAVSVRKSLASPDHIVSLIDGKPYKTLRRHLSGHGLTPEQYRERFGLKADYPMVAPAYSETRRALAKKIGLGRGKRATA